MLSVNYKVNESLWKISLFNLLTNELALVFPLTFVNLLFEKLFLGINQNFSLFFTPSHFESLATAIDQYFGVFLV
jgi:hypothetical protein